MKRCIFVAAMSLALAAPGFAWDSDRYKEDFSQSFKLNPNARVNIESFNGSIEITGWDQNQVEITGTKFASEESILKTLKVDITNTADSITVRAVRPSDLGWNRGGAGVKFVVRVPKKAQLERIQTSNGRLRVESIDGNVRLTTSNGSINASRVNGAMDLTTSNGPIELMDVNGGMMLRTSNGQIRVENAKGAFEASTSNGSIRARLDAPKGSSIRATSSNGSVELTLPAYDGNDVRVTTSNSAITLRLPPTVNANLRAVTSHASVSADYDVTTRSIEKGRLEGKIGNGGALIDLSSSNGAIRVQKI